MTEQKHRLLVADDDESVRESLRKLLRGEGYQVIAVANGSEAVEKFHQEQDRIDLLLVDLNMPMKNGWATLDRLIEGNPTLPVFIVTGQPNQNEMAEAAGVSALVEKPIDVPALLRLIQESLAKPAQSLSPCTSHRQFPFHHLRAAGSGSRYCWTRKSVSSRPHGGLNE